MTREERLGRALGSDLVVSSRLVRRLGLLVDLVQKWNPTINVVGRSTTDQIWERHILDSVQLFSCATANQSLWLDIGSGGGFPGLVIAILADEFLPGLKVALVESDKRKAVFLSEAARQIGIVVAVHACRAETLPPQAADVVSARALAALDDLCGYALRHLKGSGICAFLKGSGAEVEIEAARKAWHFEVDRVSSITDSKASVLFLRDLRRG